MACVQTTPPLKKSRRRGVCDSPSLIVYGDNLGTKYGDKRELIKIFRGRIQVFYTSNKLGDLRAE